MKRRSWFALAISFLCFGIWTPTGKAQTSPGLGKAASASLRQTLEAGLKTRRPQEFAFVALVAQKVEQGQLPRSMVEGTFFWARRRGQYPFVYFESAMRLRAKRIGVTL